MECFRQKIYIKILHICGGNLVTRKSKKQKVVALSSVEAEFRGMTKGLCELLWLRRLLMEIGFGPNMETNIFCDNKAAIDISQNPVQHDRTTTKKRVYSDGFNMAVTKHCHNFLYNTTV